MTLADPLFAPHEVDSVATEWLIGVDTAIVALAVAEHALPLVTVTV